MQPLINQLQVLQQTYQSQSQVAQIDSELPAIKVLGNSLNSYRVFHGRGHQYPGLEFVCVDLFQPVLLITFYNEPPAGWLEDFLHQAVPFFSPVISAVLVQNRHEVKAPSHLVWGVMPERVFASRDQQQFLLQLGQQQNSGFFLDMEPGRLWVEQHAQGKKILNLFAYTCAFSVVAIAAGAETVVNVDMSGRALSIGRDNHQLNGLEKSRSVFLAENILKSWGRIKRRGPYDMVILDPPSYQPGSFVAQKDYARLVRRLPELMPNGGDILACLNAPELGVDFLREVFAQQCPSCEFVERLIPHADFPDVDPERQLKLLIFRLPAANPEE